MAHTIEKSTFLILKTRFPKSAVALYQYLNPYKTTKMICAVPFRLVLKILFTLLCAEIGFCWRHENSLLVLPVSFAVLGRQSFLGLHLS